MCPAASLSCPLQVAENLSVTKDATILGRQRFGPNGFLAGLINVGSKAEGACLTKKAGALPCQPV